MSGVAAGATSAQTSTQPVLLAPTCIDPHRAGSGARECPVLGRVYLAGTVAPISRAAPSNAAAALAVSGSSSSAPMHAGLTVNVSHPRDARATSSWDDACGTRASNARSVSA